MSWQSAVLVVLAALPLACGESGMSPSVADSATSVGPPRTGAPQRIIPASAGVVDLVAALVPPERIAGLPRQARSFSAAGATSADAALWARPQFEAYAAEPLLALAPDLVICDRWQNAETTARLREAGVLVLELDDLESLESVRAALVNLGAVLGAQPACARTLADLDERVERLQVEAPRRAGWRALAYSNGGGGGWVAGAGTTADEWIRLAGLTNAGAEGGRVGHVRCSFEDLLGLDPDLIVISARGDAGEPGVTAQILNDEPGLAGLSALRNERLVQLESWLYSAVGPHLVTAAEALASAADGAMEPR